MKFIEKPKIIIQEEIENRCDSASDPITKIRLYKYIPECSFIKNMRDKEFKEIATNLGSYYEIICVQMCENSKCILKSNDFKKFCSKNRYCDECGRYLETLYLYVLYKIRDYLSSHQEFLCCYCADDRKKKEGMLENLNNS